MKLIEDGTYIVDISGVDLDDIKRVMLDTGKHCKLMYPDEPNVPDTNVGDTISRQAAINTARQYCIDNLIEDGDYHSNGIEYELNNLPSAEPERKKGKWELQEDILSWEGSFDGYFCSECGHGFLNDLCCNNGADWVDVEKDFKFCPFCGADMRGEE